MKDHSLDCEFTVDSRVLVGSSDDSGVEIVVTELTSSISRNSLVVTEHSTIGVPLTDCRRVSKDSLLNRDIQVRTKASGVSNLRLVADSIGTFKGFSLEDGGSVGLKSESRDTSED